MVSLLINRMFWKRPIRRLILSFVTFLIFELEWLMARYWALDCEKELPQCLQRKYFGYIIYFTNERAWTIEWREDLVEKVETS